MEHYCHVCGSELTFVAPGKKSNGNIIELWNCEECCTVIEIELNEVAKRIKEYNVIDEESLENSEED
jgi:transcription elongation factor Elf1